MILVYPWTIVSNFAIGRVNAGIGKLLTRVIPVAGVDQIFFIESVYVIVSPEKLGISLLDVLVIIRSEIGAICATAEVSTFVICISLANFAEVESGANPRLFVVTLAVIVRENVLCAGIENIGLC